VVETGARSGEETCRCWIRCTIIRCSASLPGRGAPSFFCSGRASCSGRIELVGVSARRSVRVVVFEQPVTHAANGSNQSEVRSELAADGAHVCVESAISTVGGAEHRGNEIFSWHDAASAHGYFTEDAEFDRCHPGVRRIYGDVPLERIDTDLPSDDRLSPPGCRRALPALPARRMARILAWSSRSETGYPIQSSAPRAKAMTSDYSFCEVPRSSVRMLAARASARRSRRSDSRSRIRVDGATRRTCGSDEIASWGESQKVTRQPAEVRVSPSEVATLGSSEKPNNPSEPQYDFPMRVVSMNAKRNSTS